MIRLKGNLNKLATAPGSIIYTGEKKDKTSEIELIQYTSSEMTRKNIDDFNRVQWKSDEVTWLNVIGVNDISMIKQIGQKCSLSNLALEDIVHIGQRPKIDFYEDYLFILLKMLTIDEKTMRIRQEQVSFVLHANTLISFQEEKGDVFDSVRKRISENLGVIRKKDADYLLYCLIDAIVDEYFILLNKIDEKLDEFEDKIIHNSNMFSLQEIYNLRRELLSLKTSVWPIQEIINSMLREGSLISDNTKVYLKDINDNISQIMDYIVMFREMISSLFDTHLSLSSNKMNQIMTTLTIFSAIFIPLTFLAGVYGMNFEFIPELSFKWSYPLFWLISVIVAMGMHHYFKKKGWL